MLGIAKAGVVVAWVVVGCNEAKANLQVDLRPCLIFNSYENSTNPTAYFLEQYFKAFWSANPYVLEVGDGIDSLDLEQEPGHGKCNAIYIGDTFYYRFVEKFSRWKYEDALTDQQWEEIWDYAQEYEARVAMFGAQTYWSDRFHELEIKESTEYYPQNLTSLNLTDKGKEVDTIINTEAALPVRVSPPVILAKANCPLEPMGVYTAMDGVVNGSLPMGFHNASWDTGNVQILYVFFDLAYWDVYSWTWAHYIVDWAAQGVYQGERVFYFGAMLDDLFLATPLWDVYYNRTLEAGGDPEVEVRMTGDDLRAVVVSQDNTTALLPSGSYLTTEFPFNGLGVVPVDDPLLAGGYGDTDLGFTDKGWRKPLGSLGQSPLWPEDWLSYALVRIPEAAANWTEQDDLLQAVLEEENLSKLYLQSHTFAHMARDNISYQDCEAEDWASISLATALGVYDEPGYSRRSMTTGAISGLFNGDCLRAGSEAGMTCVPGDNTLNLLVNDESSYYPVNTTVEEHGFAGVTIAPRFATEMPYNCVDADCTILFYQYFRRTECECDDPGDTRSEAGCETDCDLGYDTFEELLEGESWRIVSNIVAGYRDKYMMHQANAIRFAYGGRQVSLLQLLMEEVANVYSVLMAAPLTTPKFDDLCDSFNTHVLLDRSEAVITATLTEEGLISELALTMQEDLRGGLVPVTLRTDRVAGLEAGGPVEDPGHDGEFTTHLGEESFPISLSDGTTAAPTPAPTTPAPTASPTLPPTNRPTPAPTASPTLAPTNRPTPAPTASPTLAPTNRPTPAPTASPTLAPTGHPTPAPTTPAPTASPTLAPTNRPTSAPTTPAPTASPTTAPTSHPTSAPTPVPTVSPTTAPAEPRTTAPTTPTPTASPTLAPTNRLTSAPTTPAPTASPTRAPTGYPTSVPTTPAPTATWSPTLAPTNHLTSAPTIQAPTASPTTAPTAPPTPAAPTTPPPTASPTPAPTASEPLTPHPTTTPPPTSSATSVEPPTPATVPTTPGAPTPSPTPAPTTPAPTRYSAAEAAAQAGTAAPTTTPLPTACEECGTAPPEGSNSEYAGPLGPTPAPALASRMEDQVAGMETSAAAAPACPGVIVAWMRPGQAPWAGGVVALLAGLGLAGGVVPPW